MQNRTPTRRKLIAGFFVAIASLTILAVPQRTQAVAMAWPDIGGFTYGEMLSRSYDKFTNELLAMLKVQAAMLIHGRMQALLTGQSGTPLFITNYQQFIYASSQQQSQLVMANFFNSLSAGASSYTQGMLRGVEQQVNNEIFRGMDGAKTTIDEYVHGGINNVFNTSAGGGFAASSAAFDNPMNNPYGAYLVSSQEAMRQMAMRQDINRTQAITNGGYISPIDPKTNLIKTPGSLIKDLTSYVESLPMQIMAYARSIPEVIGTMAAETLSNTIQNGVSKVTQPIDNQLINIHNGVTGGVNQVQSQIYNGIKFTGEPQKVVVPVR